MMLMVKKKTIFSAHLVTTLRLCRENLELLLSERLLSSLQIQGDGNDSDVGNVDVDEDVSLGALALICCEPNLSVQGSWMATTSYIAMHCLTFDPILKPCRFSGMKEALGLTAESKVMLVSKNCFKISQLE